VGELQALRVEHVDLDGGVVRIRKGWDRVEGEIEPKSKAAKRDIPLPQTLRPFIAEHLLGLEWSRGLIFGRTPDKPFSPTTLRYRAGEAWKAAKLAPVSFHDCRHTYASLMIAAAAEAKKQVNVKALSEFMGHTSVTVTYDRYGHLLPNAHEDAASMLDSYLATVSL
jgi:integrase